MAMQSQSPRGVSGGRGRRKGLGKLPKLLILAGVIVLVAIFFWPEGDGNAAADPTGDVPPTPDLSGNANANAGGSSGGASLGLEDRQAPPVPATDRTQDDTPPAPPTRVEPEDTSPTPPPPREVTFSGGDAATLYNRGDKLIADGDLVGGRTVLSRLLFASDNQLNDRDAMAVRQRLNDVNATLFWSPEIIDGDPITGPYKVDSLLGPIGVKHRVPYQLLERVNNLKAEQLQLDKTIKIVRGPIHARVIKHLFLMDLYALDAEGLPVYICSFNVGLGTNDKTPVGAWQVTKGSKTPNPDWRDDQNNQYFPSNDPNNPIGEFWIAIHGLDANTRNKSGFGIHGTIDPDSIGKEASRGCIRLADGDIELVFAMLTDHSQGSRIQIVP